MPIAVIDRQHEAGPTQLDCMLTSRPRLARGAGGGGLIML